MADQWDDFADAPTANGGDAWGEFADAGDTPAPAAQNPWIFKVPKLDGKEVSFEVPLGADDETIRQLAAKATGEPRYATAVIDRAAMGGEEAAAPDITPEATDNSAIRGFVAGALKPIDNAVDWINNTAVGRAVDDFGVSIGLPSGREAVAANEQMRQNNTRTGYQTLGNIAGTLPLAAVPGANTAAGAAATGALGGALLSNAKDSSGVLTDAALGGAGGTLGNLAARGLGGLASGVTDAAARRLHEAGIPLTLGQIGQASGNALGRAAGYIEDVAAGTPFIGQFVNAARDRGITAFNRAVGDRVLENIGEKLPAGVKAGHEAIEAVGRKLSDRYEKLVPNLSATADQQFAQDMRGALDLAEQASRGGQLDKVVQKVFGNRVQNGSISGQQLKDAESELTRLYGNYSRSTGDEALFGEALDGVRQALRGAVARSNPEHGAELQALNTGWAQLKAVRNAVRTGSDKAKASGMVTPGGILRQSSNRGFRDQLAEDATGILPNRTPDSGTAGRLLTLGLLGGGVAVDPTEHPFLSAALAGAGALSTRGGQRALNTFALGSRPAALEAAGEGLQKLSRYAPAVVAPVAIGGDR
jgi:hypothetical protein